MTTKELYKNYSKEELYEVLSSYSKTIIEKMSVIAKLNSEVEHLKSSRWSFLTETSKLNQIIGKEVTRRMQKYMQDLREELFHNPSWIQFRGQNSSPAVVVFQDLVTKGQVHVVTDSPQEARTLIQQLAAHDKLGLVKQTDSTVF